MYYPSWGSQNKAIPPNPPRLKGDLLGEGEGVAVYLSVLRRSVSVNLTIVLT